MKMLRCALISITSCGLAGTQSGCLLVAAGAAAGTSVAYVKGDLNATVNAPPDQVASAAESAMKDLQLNVISREASRLDSRVVGRTARDTRLTVTAKSEGSASRLSIRAGVFGDSAIQAQLLEKIQNQLTEKSAASAATQPSLAKSTTQPAVADSRE